MVREYNSPYEDLFSGLTPDTPRMIYKEDLRGYDSPQGEEPKSIPIEDRPKVVDIEEW